MPSNATRELLDRLQRHYIKPGEPLPGGVFLPEVGWNGGTGGRGTFGTGGTCDAIYIGFTTTSGRVLVGHELKVSRADWVKELNSPGNAFIWAGNGPCFCTVGAITAASRTKAIRDEALRAVRHALDPRCRSIEAWNDLPRTTLEDAKTLLQRAKSYVGSVAA